jgi:hypothetical protein
VSAVRILDAIRAGQVNLARDMFAAAVDMSDDVAASALIRQLADRVPIPAGTVLLGPSPLVWGNPFRGGWAWRCGPCDPDTWSDDTERRARRALARHIAEHHPGGLPIHEAT